jgi:hypothetical protein
MILTFSRSFILEQYMSDRRGREAMLDTETGQLT